MEAIRNYVDALFAALPQDANTQRIKADMLASLEEKYQTLLAEGKSPAEATGLVIASIGSADELRETFGLNGTPQAAAPQPQTPPAPDSDIAREYGRYLARKHGMIAAAVALFILAPFVRSVASDPLESTAGNFAFFAMIAVGVALCILSGRRDDYYRELYGLGRDEDDEERAETANKQKHLVSTLFASIAFPVATAVYLCIGVFADLWHPGWIIFPACAAVTAAITACEEYRSRTSRTK